MESLTLVSYGLTMVFVLIFAMTRGAVMLELKRKFFTGKGYAYIGLIGVDKRLQIAFINMKADYFKIGKRVFVKNGSKSVLMPGGDIVESPAKLVPYVVKNGENAPSKKVFDIAAKKDGNIRETVNDDGYVLDMESAVYSGKYPMFFFRYDNPEPVDFFLTKKSVTTQVSTLCPNEACKTAITLEVPVEVPIPRPVDSEYYDIIIQKAKSLGSLKNAMGGDRNLKILILIAVGAAAVAAWYGMQNNTALQALVKQGTHLVG